MGALGFLLEIFSSFVCLSIALALKPLGQFCVLRCDTWCWTRPPQPLQLSAQPYQLVPGSLDLKNKHFHYELCQVGRKTDFCTSKSHHSSSAKSIWAFWSFLEATSTFTIGLCGSALRAEFLSSGELILPTIVIVGKQRKHCSKLLGVKPRTSPHSLRSITFVYFNSRVDGDNPV